MRRDSRWRGHRAYDKPALHLNRHAPKARTSRRALAREIRRRLECGECHREVDIPAMFHRPPGHRKHVFCAQCHHNTEHIEL